MFQVIDKPEKGKILLKCPKEDCDDCFLVSLLRYPKYNKTKRPRRGTHLSSAKWYVYSLHCHLLKNHKEESDDTVDNGVNDDRAESIGSETLGSDRTDEDCDGFRRENHDSLSHSNGRNSPQRIQDTPEGNGTPNQLAENPLKRKARADRPFKFTKRTKQ